MIERLKSYVVERLGINRLAEEIAGTGSRADVLNAELRAAQDLITSLEARLAEFGNVQDDLRRRDRIAATSRWGAGAPLRHRPLLSVVMATRNRADLLVDAIDSVVGQTYDRWELVVVDDGSDDATSEVVSARASTDQRIRLEVTEGVGAAAARNIGIGAATGDYVAFLDDDNALAPDWLRSIAEFTGRRPDVAAFYGVTFREDVADPDVFPWVHFEPTVDLVALRTANHVDLGALVVRRDHRELRFDDSLTRYIDWELVVRLAEAGGLEPVPVVAGFYSTRADSRISRDPDQELLAEMHRRFGVE